MFKADKGFLTLKKFPFIGNIFCSNNFFFLKPNNMKKLFQILR